MLMWARVFVFLVFSMLGATFLATTGILAWEFKAHWLDFAALDSHLFVFFPTLGIVALIAFFVPSVLLTDLYWRHISFGKARFLFGFFVLAAASYWISGYLLDSPRRSYWEGAPRSRGGRPGRARWMRGKGRAVPAFADADGGAQSSPGE